MLSPHKAANETGAAAATLDGAAHDVDRGWRRPSGTPSLAEVFGSIRTRPTGSLFTKLLAFLGPGYLVAVGYMDPGNWATSLAGGSKFGYALLTIALMSNLMAILLQALCIRLGIASRRDLAQACRDAFPRFVAYPLWALAELAICATDLAEVIGTAIGLNLLFGIPLEIGVLLTALDVFLILWMQQLGFRYVETSGGDAVPGHRRLLRHSDRHGRSELGRSDPRLRADRRDREEPGDALSGARHHRRHGDAA